LHTPPSQRIGDKQFDPKIGLSQNWILWKFGAIVATLKTRGEPKMKSEVNLPKQSKRRIRGTLRYLLVSVAIFTPAAGRCDDGRSTQHDAAMTAAFADCDRQAEQETAQVSTLTPIAPTSVLSPILLLNDLNRRKQEEANQPRLLEQIELKRQQCRRNVVAAATQRAQELMAQKSDDARGYKRISFETFALDAKTLAASQGRISMKGAYLPDGNSEWFFSSQTEAIQATNSPEAARNIARIPLLTEDADRGFRQVLLRCKSTPGSDHLGCPTVVTGHVSLCTITSPLGNSGNLPCFVVENGRALR
jgi:hypothetical protein